MPHRPSLAAAYLAALTITFLPSALAVDAEGVTERKAGPRHLQPYERTSNTTPQDSPDAAKKGFRRAKIPAGFKADLWATEPLLANPVAFSFDGQGRMYIAETHRYRTSVLDIRHYMFMLEDDMANRNQADWEKSIKKNFPNDWQDLGKESEVVRLVQDTNVDGVADKSSAYAEGFNSIIDGIASGVLARPEGVWLANIPGLYKLTGLSAEGKSEKKEEVFRGFGIRFNYTGHDLHGLIKGPDGRIYFSIGDRGTSVKTKEGSMLEVPDEGAIFRCEEDGSHLELVMRGLRNPQELAFDDHGNLFTCDNDSDQGDRERFVYVVEGGDAGWRVGYQHCPQAAERNPWLAEAMWQPRQEGKNQPYYILSPLANMPDGPGGLVHYPGTGMPEKYKGCFFVACYKGTSATSQVAVFKPVADGASFKLEMLESFIPGCQATDVDFGPDSRMYVSFWDEGWERTAQGRIMKVEHDDARQAQAAQISEVQRLLAEGMKKREVAELSRLLGHTDQRLRLEAQWELASRGLEAVQNGSANRTGLAKLHEIWALGQIARTWKTEADQAKKQALALQLAALVKNSPEPEVAVQAMRLLGTLAQSKTADAVIETLGHSSARLRLFAAEALGRFPAEARYIDPLLALAAKDALTSQEIRTAVAVALAKLAGKNEECYQAVSRAINHTNEGVQLAALLTSNKIGGAKGAAIAIKALSATKGSLLDEATRMLSDEGLEDFTAASTPWGEAIERGKRPMTQLRAINSFYRKGDARSAERLVQSLASEESRIAPEVAVEGFKMLSEWKSPAARHRLTGVFRPISQSQRQAFDASLVTLESIEREPSITLQALDFIQSIGQANWAPYVTGLVFNAKKSPTIRIKALSILDSLKAGDSAEFPPSVANTEKASDTSIWIHQSYEQTLEKAIKDPLSALRIAAAGLLGATKPHLAVEGLSTALATGTAEDKKAAYVALNPIKTAEADALIALQLDLLAKNQVPSIAQLELLTLAGSREADSVKKALDAYHTSLPKDDALAKYLACLEGGDAAKGKTLYSEHPVAACRRCHTINRSGGEAGPALDAIALRQDRRYLLESIVAPNAKIADSFRMIVCSMKDGTVKAGVIKSETSDGLTIQSPGEEPQTLKLADIASREALPSGMMPGLGELLTKSELRDLVAYLATLTEPLKAN